MFYMLANNIVWIAAASAVGLAVGWLTTTRASNDPFSSGWGQTVAICSLAEVSSRLPAPQFQDAQV